MLDKTIAAVIVTFAILLVACLIFAGSYGLLRTFGVGDFNAIRTSYLIGLAALAVCVVGAMRRW